MIRRAEPTRVLPRPYDQSRNFDISRRLPLFATSPAQEVNQIDESACVGVVGVSRFPLHFPQHLIGRQSGMPLAIAPFDNALEETKLQLEALVCARDF
jgi:hypothetical protein